MRDIGKKWQKNTIENNQRINKSIIIVMSPLYNREKIGTIKLEEKRVKEELKKNIVNIQQHSETMMIVNANEAKQWQTLYEKQLCSRSFER